MAFEKVRTMLRWAVSPASNSRRAEPPPAGDARVAAGEIDRSVEAVLGNLALILTQLDPASDAHARARRTLDEARHIREVVSHWPEAGTDDALRHAA
jgi:hypothetical protein